MTVELSRRIMPKDAKVFLKRTLKQFLGFLLFVVVCLTGVAVLSYHSQDPSLNTLSGNAPKNWLGIPGALAADVIIQLFGFSGLVLLFILGGWGWFMGRRVSFRVTARHIFLTVLSVLGLAVFFNGCWPLARTSSSVFYSGGSLGFLLGHFLQTFFFSGHFLALFHLFLWFLGFLSFSLVWFAMGLSWNQLTTSMRVVVKSFKGVWKAFRGTHVKESFKFLKAEESTEPILGKTRKQELVFGFDSQPPQKPVTEEALWPQDPTTVQDPSDTADVLSQQALDKLFTNQEFSDDYQLPPLELLDPLSSSKGVKPITQEALQESSKQLESVLEEFGIRGAIVNIRPGPVVTMYELKPAAGIKTARVIGLADDIARSMSALSARIAVIPGQNVIGIELPNPQRQTVYLRELLSSAEYQNSQGGLPLILGKDIAGNPSIADLTRMPHLLVAGTTGSGKSVSVNTMILSLLYKLSPDHCKFIMIDPKMLELSVYDDIPHLLTPVVTDPKKAVVALKWAVKEMENRYRSMAKLGVRNIDGFNGRLKEARQNGEVLVRRVQTGFDPDSGRPIFENQALDFQPLPYIVVVVDEMADLMLVAGKEIEAAVQRLAQMARAAGIHLIMATQRPSVDVITGTIKANFPTRISFQVTSKIDSRTILGEQGAEQLLGQGDMLYMAGGGRISRVHGPFVRDDEVERIVKFLKRQGEPNYIESVTHDDEETFDVTEDAGKSGGDDLYRQALDLVMREGKVSTSFIQRHLQIGYNRAARIVDQMEKEGVISAANHVGKREILKG